MLSATICDLVQDEYEDLCKTINANICSMVHPQVPCRFWRKEYGAVPDAVSRYTFNDKILCAEFLVWPEPESGKSLRHAEWRALQ